MIHCVVKLQRALHRKCLLQQIFGVLDTYLNRDLGHELGSVTQGLLNRAVECGLRRFLLHLQHTSAALAAPRVEPSLICSPVCARLQDRADLSARGGAA